MGNLKLPNGVSIGDLRISSRGFHLTVQKIEVPQL